MSPRRPPVIGLVGRARAGKDSAGSYLKGYGYTPRSFAEPLKQAARAVFDLTSQEVHGLGYDREAPHPFWGMSVREMLQRLGTESVRNVFGPDHWVRLMEKRLDPAKGPYVITDVRFPNEVEMVKRMGGEVWGVVRENYEHGPVEHESERMAAEDLDKVCDKVLVASNLELLCAGIERLLWSGDYNE